MIYTSHQLATICKMSKFGFQKLAKRLDIKHSLINNKFLFCSEDGFSDFYSSINQVCLNPELKVFYSIRDMADKRCQHKDTIRAFISKHNIKTYHSGKKVLILLIDLLRFKQQIGSNQQPM